MYTLQVVYLMNVFHSVVNIMITYCYKLVPFYGIRFLKIKYNLKMWKHLKFIYISIFLKILLFYFIRLFFIFIRFHSNVWNLGKSNNPKCLYLTKFSIQNWILIVKLWLFKVNILDVFDPWKILSWLRPFDCWVSQDIGTDNKKKECP